MTNASQKKNSYCFKGKLSYTLLLHYFPTKKELNLKVKRRAIFKIDNKNT